MHHQSLTFGGAYFFRKSVEKASKIWYNVE